MSTSWTKTANIGGLITPEDLNVIDDLEPSQPLFDPAAHEQILMQNYAEEEKLKMEMLAS